MNIFVSNLSFKVDEESLKQLFQNYGEVTSCKIVTDKFTGRSRGFGFVEMKSD
ncbi:MAG TPA: RNA-binding protein, partial [Bacteroidia bacterium]|nr:RNA-binding protein [Bacteroidia bacterium]